MCVVNIHTCMSYEEEDTCEAEHALARRQDHLDVAKSYNNIAIIYKNQGKYEEALEMYSKSLDIKRSYFLAKSKSQIMCIQGDVDWSNSVPVNHCWNFAVTAKTT